MKRGQNILISRIGGFEQILGGVELREPLSPLGVDLEVLEDVLFVDVRKNIAELNILFGVDQLGLAVGVESNLGLDAFYHGILLEFVLQSDDSLLEVKKSISAKTAEKAQKS